MTIFAGQPNGPADAKICVTDLNGLGPYLKAELINKKHIQITVVDEEPSAECAIQ